MQSMTSRSSIPAQHVQRGGTTVPVQRSGTTVPVQRGGTTVPVQRGGTTVPVQRGGTTVPVQRGGTTATREVEIEDRPNENFLSLQKEMETELEQRRKEWESEVERMQQEFFKVHLPSGHVIKNQKAVEYNVNEDQPSVDTTAPEVSSLRNMKNIYVDGPDGKRVFRHQFDVQGFPTEAIKVRAEGQKVTVSAKYNDELGDGRRETKQFNRQVDLPAGVDPDTVISYLSDDGNLVVEAPVDEEKMAGEVVKIPNPRPEVTVVHHPVYIRAGQDIPNYDQYLDSGRLGVEEAMYASKPLMPPPDYSFVSGNGANVIGGCDVPQGDITVNRGGVADPQSVSNFYSSRLGPNHYRYRSSGVPSTRSKSPTAIVYRTSANPDALYQTSSTHSTHGGPIIRERHTDFIKRSASPHILESTAHRLTPTGYHSVAASSSSRGASPSQLTGLGGMSARYSSPTIVTTDDNIKRLKLTVDVGHDYDAEDISVKLIGRKIRVEARHEETVAGRTSRREFSRDFDLPDMIEAWTLRAVLSADGRLFLGASCDSNLDHDAAIRSTQRDFPATARPVRCETT